MLLSVLLPGRGDATLSLPTVQRMSEITPNITKLFPIHGSSQDKHLVLFTAGNSAEKIQIFLKENL
jgi:hypothetical protein